MSIKMMDSDKKGLQRRMSVSLDLESVELIERLQTEYQTSKSEVVRKALDYLKTVSEEGNLSPESLKTIINLYSRPDVISLDLGIVEAFSKEVGEGSEEFKDNLREIGKDLYQEYSCRGIESIHDCLKTIEKTNLFNVISISEDSFTLISNVQSMENHLESFLEGLFEDAPEEADITEEHGKIRIRLEEKV